MADVKSTTIVPIAFYCFVLGVYFLSLAVNAAFGDKSDLAGSDISMWLTVFAFVVLTVCTVTVGIGFLHLKPMYWKILFFSLAASVPSIAAFLIAYWVFLFLGIGILTPYYQAIQKAPGGVFAFLSFFLSEIIILYYLAGDEVVSSFGKMGPLLTPF